MNGNENRTLSYDARDRMSGATAPNIYGQEIAEYDVLDNVRRLAGAPNGLGGYVQDYRYQYDTSQRLDRIDNEVGTLQWDFTHNGFGETTNRSGHNALWSYQWNAAGRMTQASRNGTARPYTPFAPDLPPIELDPPHPEATTWETYVYDAHGHRTRSSRSDGSSPYQVYSRAGQLLYVEDTKDDQRIDYIHLGGKLVAQRSRPLYSSTATVTYHHTDHIGSANVETNVYGSQTERTFHMPYGSPYDGFYREGPGYAGHVTDTQTNLTYMQQRYYDLVALRFLSPDPVDVSAVNGSNFNRYWYANNNPYWYVDPDGRCATRSADGSCVVGIDPSLAGNAKAQEQRQVLQDQLNVIDPAVRATPDSASADVITSSYEHLGTITGKELKALWNNQNWTIVPDESSTNGGWGAASLGLIKLEVRAVEGYQNNAVQWGLPAATGLNTLIFHELGHNTDAGLQLQSKYYGAVPRTEQWDAREQKTSTIGRKTADMTGVSFSCAVARGCR